MEFLKKLWNWLLGQTTVDEKIEAKVVVEETKDVVKTVKPRKPRKPKA